MKRLFFRAWTFPLVLLLVCWLGYGLLLPGLGFYWDDWPSVWFLHTLGPAGFKDVFAIDRPLLGWLFSLTMPLIGESTIGWQVFGILTRWLSCLVFWWSLLGLWPQRVQEISWMTLLLAIYPGFKQQYISVTYANTWITLSLFLLSLGMMIWAQHFRRRASTGSATGASSTAAPPEPVEGEPVEGGASASSATGASSAAAPPELVEGEPVEGGASASSATGASSAAAPPELVEGGAVEGSRRKKEHLIFWLLMLGSWVLATFVMFTDEYYVGLELLRPVILWMLLTPAPPYPPHKWGGAGGGRQRLTAIALQWTPYLLSLAAFIAWRGFLQTTPRGQIQIFDHLLRSPAATLLNLAQTILQDIAEVSLVAWWQTLNWKALLGIGSLQNLAYVALVLATTVALIIYLLFYKAGNNPRVSLPAGEPNLNPHPAHLPVARGDNDSRKWAIQAVLIGALALFLGGWPFWVTDLPIKLKFPNDRFTLSMMFGACILLVGVISLLARARWQKVILVAALAGLSVGLQFQNGLTYRNDWETQRAFFWQLTWRAPNLQPGTAVMSANMPFKYDTDNSLTAPLNWLYAPDFRGGAQEMPYLMVDIDVRLGNGLEGLQPGQDIRQPYRATSFSGSTSQVIVYAYTPPGCLKILDPAADSRLPVKSKWVAQALPLSNPQGLIADQEYSSVQPPQHIFGSPPAPDWCYYFEKADLARQTKDWQQVASLGDQALKLARSASVDKPIGLKEPSELLPFIEGYAHTGQWEKAIELTQQASNLSEKLQPALCDAWDRIRKDTLLNDEKRQALALMTTSLGCRWP